MPRGRKKTTCLSLRKPRLHFTESPVQVQKKPVSPVLGAENPVTAKSVQLDDYSDISWISPNFKELRSRYQITGCRRNLRPRKAKATDSQQLKPFTRLRNQAEEKENNSLTGKAVQKNRRKFKPLTFLQDESDNELQSELQSISELNSISEHPTISQNTSISENTSISGNTSVSEYTSSSPGKRTVQVDSFQDDVSIHTPVLNLSGVSHASDVNVTVRCNTDNQPCLCVSPISRHSAQNTNPCPLHQVNSHSKHRTDSQLNTRKSSSLMNHRHSSLSSSVNLKSSYYDYCDSPNTNLRRSSRLREKYLEAVKLFQCSSPKVPTRVLKVLAEDTPESEYQQRIKKRQIMHNLAVPL